MKTIILGRHAKSSWAEPDTKDFDRPLNDRGQHDAPKMAIELNKTKYVPEYILTSSANRALSTAEFYAEEFNLPIHQNEEIYHGFIYDYLKAIQSLPESCTTAIVFGHNPILTEIANVIKPGCIDNVPTSGLIIAHSSANLWKDLLFENCTLEKILYPKMIS